jgi:hypothetical protein
MGRSAAAGCITSAPPKAARRTSRSRPGSCARWTGRATARRDWLGVRTLPDQAAAITKLFAALSTARSILPAYELAGPSAAAWDDSADSGRGIESEAADITFLVRQAMCIGGGTTEMNRQVVAERVLGMPRIPGADNGVPFRDIPHRRS